ncbi:MAG TPA: hypothetical protein VFD92_15280 [Candidatus Binatia bacterium]|nr:hypothetical protein [Candidatus Binatia bacterium]
MDPTLAARRRPSIGEDEAAAISADALVALVALARGVLRSGAMPGSPAGQAALADWVVSLDVAGRDVSAARRGRA